MASGWNEVTGSRNTSYDLSTNAVRSDFTVFLSRVMRIFVMYKCGCVGVKAQRMLSGKVRTCLFETGRFKKGKKKLQDSNTKHLLFEPDRTMQRGLCTALHLPNVQQRLSVHRWGRQLLLLCILERSGKKTKNKHYRWIFNISSEETERPSQIEPVKPRLFRGSSHSWCCSLWKRT